MTRSDLRAVRAANDSGPLMYVTHTSPDWTRWDEEIEILGLQRNEKGRIVRLFADYQGEMVEISATPDGFVFIGAPEEGAPEENE